MGYPLRNGISVPFMAQAIKGPPLKARSISIALTNSGVPGSAGRSSPRSVICLEPARTPARSSTVFNGMPVHRALPIEPLPSCAPNTLGDEKPRLLPAHWLTATISTVSPKAFNSARLRDKGLFTCPVTVKRCCPTSIDVGKLGRW